MNWQKANQALGNIERLLQVFETTDNLSSIERDLLLRRIQDLYEIVLDNKDSVVKSNLTVKTTSKPVVQTPPIIEKRKVEERVELPRPKVELPKVEIRKEERKAEVTPKVEKTKIETPKIELPKVERKPVEIPKVETPKSSVFEERTYHKPVVTTQFNDEEAEIIEEFFKFKVATDLSEKLSASPIRDLTTSMSINERFITISELFKGNKSKYDEAIHELNNFYNFEQAKVYMLNHLISEYNWTKKKKIKSAKSFIKKVRRRYL